MIDPHGHGLDVAAHRGPERSDSSNANSRATLGDITAALTYEAEVQSIAGDTSDAREGIRAFRVKRAVFAGH